MSVIIQYYIWVYGRPWQLAVVKAVRSAVQKLWPTARVEIFGSFATVRFTPFFQVFHMFQMFQITYLIAICIF